MIFVKRYDNFFKTKSIWNVCVTDDYDGTLMTVHPPSTWLYHDEASALKKANALSEQYGKMEIKVTNDESVDRYFGFER